MKVGYFLETPLCATTPANKNALIELLEKLK